MITMVSIKNFRSIESADIKLGPITVFYGPTASGKSTLLYATQVLRNFVLNPGRQADGFFHLGFMDLGGFDACVLNHEDRKISISITHEMNGKKSTYGLTFGKAVRDIELTARGIILKAKVAIPYGLNQTFPFSYKDGSDDYTINWNGIACALVPKTPTTETQQKALEIASSLNVASESLKGIDVAPHKRGFFKPSYTPVAVSPTPTTEDEVASIIINDPNLPGRISGYSDEIFGRDFRLHLAPGTATAFFYN